MANIFSKRVRDKFATQVPKLSSFLSQAEMSLEPTMQPPFEMSTRSIIYQQLAYKAARTITKPPGLPMTNF
jgi:3-methyladenine DNA glycosylase/8-oxoguanine DNA glycosylase